MTGSALGVWLSLALVAASALVSVAAPRQPGEAARLSFNRDVRPILADNCFVCHGPDSGTRKVGLRLDQRDVAVGRGVIVPGRPERSRLIARIFATEESRRMPPVASHKRLTQEQKETLRRWIAQGAVYERHWAFTSLPTAVSVPRVTDPARWRNGGRPPALRATPPPLAPGAERNGIDRFVLARLDREGLRPSPPATRADWIRRVTLDLTGLPPSPRDVDAFLVDGLNGAYERVVDRLLSTPRYGERMALPWLDVARYADSYGYQSDQLCTTWPYRDWVVKAFNDNLPYDQFITWQLAGDLLPNATREQRLATAFNRLHRMTNEGGSVPEEWRMEGVADRVQTLGTAFMGLTLECAHCHDHKYDPISHRDYYAVSAFFNSIDEHGLYDRADIVPSPSLLLPTPEQERELTAAREAVAQAEQGLAKAKGDREAAFRSWLAGERKVALADLTGRFDFEQFEETTLRNLAPGATLHGKREDVVPLVGGRVGKAASFDGENNVHFPELGRFTRHTPFTLAFWMQDSGTRPEPAVVFQACSGTDTGPHGYDLLLEGGRLTARLFRHWPGNAVAVRTRAAVPKETWAHVAVTYDGSSRAAGLRIYLDGKPAAVEVLRDKLVKSTGQHTLVFGQRFRDRGFKGGRIDELFIFARDLTPLEIASLFDGQEPGAQSPEPRAQSASDSELRATYFSAVDPETRAAAAALAAARQRMVAAEDAQVEVAVMEEMPAPRPTYVLARGRYDAPKSEANRVGRDVPAAILPFPNGLRRDRLGLAQWLTRPDHPLTARVAVNRVWAILFGRGLVETVENFGIQGRPPSHPELLDWLAREFVRSGWNVKGLVKQIVLSNTYRQSSALHSRSGANGGGVARSAGGLPPFLPDLRARDPQNILLVRGPSHRLSAEAIRDAALLAAGLLDERLGGPPVSPYQPGDLWRESNSMSPAYKQSVGGDLYRRSLYTVWKRTAPMPNMTAFDAGSREVCLARRQTTSTPLQALVLLNDPQFVEAARMLGQRTLQEGGSTPAERARFAFRQLASREPTPTELRLLTALYEGERSFFAAAPEEAAKLIRIGDRKPDPALPPAELAAATVLAQTVLNLDATIWIR